MKPVRTFVLYIFALLLLATLPGCPDYSHLRPEPDYENMTDGGGESEEVEAEDR